MNDKFKEVSQKQFYIFLKYRKNLAIHTDFKSKISISDWVDTESVTYFVIAQTIHSPEAKYFILEREYEEMIEDLNVLAAAKCL